MSKKDRLDVFGYLDHRAFLRDYYLAEKARGRGFSYRAFSRRAGLRSPNYLKLVIDGERNLTAAMAERFARACKLDEEEVEFFVDLVAFDQASSAGERNAAFAKLTGFKKYRRAHTLELAQDAYHSTWYLPAIRELTARADFDEDPAWIADTLRPRITPKEAARAVETLLALSLLRRDEDGRLVQSEPLVSTGSETHGMHVVNYHRTMIARGAEALDVFRGPERDVSSLTLCVSEDGLERLKKRIQRFRRELLELSTLEDNPVQVVQVNFQLFPLSAGRERP